MTTAVVTQPTYLSWLGYFESISRADVFVVLDTAQYARKSWHCRNRLKGPDGEPTWITVPVDYAPLATPIHDIVVADPATWVPQHRAQLEAAFTDAPHGDEALALVLPVLADPPERLVDLNVRILQATAAALGLEPRWVRASELEVAGSRSELVVSICAAVGADAYYAAAGSRGYMEHDQATWDRSGLTVEFQSWPHPTYPQVGGGEFVSHLAAIDAIANVGAAAARELLATHTSEEPA